jgi:hypothetical protein
MFLSVQGSLCDLPETGKHIYCSLLIDRLYDVSEFDSFSPEAKNAILWMVNQENFLMAIFVNGPNSHH